MLLMEVIILSLIVDFSHLCSILLNNIFSLILHFYFLETRCFDDYGPVSDMHEYFTLEAQPTQRQSICPVVSFQLFSNNIKAPCSSILSRSYSFPLNILLVR